MTKTIDQLISEANKLHAQHRDELAKYKAAVALVKDWTGSRSPFPEPTADEVVATALQHHIETLRRRISLLQEGQVEARRKADQEEVDERERVRADTAFRKRIEEEEAAKKRADDLHWKILAESREKEFQDLEARRAARRAS